MAQSPGSADRRARLIREMARQSERSNSRLSDASSVESGRVPNHEAGDTLPQQLPALARATPERMPRIRVPEGEFQINTSALRRAFPDFSQYGSSDDDDSIEMGRGLPRVPEHQTTLSEEPSEDMTFEFADGKKYRVTGTPPLKARPNKANAGHLGNRDVESKSIRGASQKENQDPLAKTLDIMSSSGGSSKASKPDRQVLRELHARVESDDSISVNGTQPLRKNSKRNARFIDKQDISIREDATTTNELNHDRPRQETTASSAVNGTHESFLLPDLPNITELVSGVHPDGTPLFSRSAKARSRFATPSSLRRSQNGKTTHVPLEQVPAASSDQALLVSLQYLQDRVAALEIEKKGVEDRAGEYELEVLQLRSKLQKQQDETGEVGFLESHQEDNRYGNWETERRGFENTIKSLESRLAQANKKVSNSELTVQRLTKGQSTGQQQLAKAQVGSLDLRKESEHVQHEILRLRQQLRRMTQQHEERIEELADQEQGLRQKIERREKAVNEMAQLAKELWSTRSQIASDGRTEHRDLSQSAVSCLGRSQQRPSASENAGSVRSAPRSLTRNQNVSQSDLQKSSLARPRSRQNDGMKSDVRSDLQDEFSKRASFLSFMDGDEVAKLQMILDQDKAQLEQLQPSTAIVAPSVTTASQHVPRKSSLKVSKQSGRAHHVQYEDEVNGLSNQANRMANHDDDPMTTEIDITGPNEITRDTTKTSATTRSQARRGSSAKVDDITSAFILPDITLSQAGIEAQKDKSTSAGATKSDTKTTIARPVPVTERVIPLLSGEEEPTMRPAQPPALALAAVLKSLKDELAQIRAELEPLQARYQSHDPALGKRERKTVFTRIQKLLAGADARSDQIYALYDVLEGQKACGMTMQEDEVELTLQQVGVDTTILKGGAAKRQDKKPDVLLDGAIDARDSEYEASEDDVTGDAPWEGIDPTRTMESLGSLEPHRR